MKPGLIVQLFVGHYTSTGPAVDNDDKVYVTGSRIPRNDPSSSGVKATEDPDVIRSIMRPRSVGGGGN